MTMQTLPDFLLTPGLNARFNPDGHIAFDYEDFTYLLCFDEKDPEFALLLLPKVWPLDDGDALHDVREALDLVNRTMKVVKGYTQRGQVSFSIEIWLRDPGEWVHFLQRALRNLDFARMQFGAHLAACQAVRAMRPPNATIQ